MKPSTKKGEDRVKTIRLPIFLYSVKVTLTDDVEAAFKREFPCDRTDLSYTDALCHHKGARAFIYYPRYPRVGTIAHEAYHAVCRMLTFVGADPEEEVVAYHVDYLTDVVYRFAFAEFTTKSKTKKKTKRSTVAKEDTEKA